jgi:hypothetical protein
MVVRARLDLLRLANPDPVVLASTERAVQRAEATLRMLTSAKPPSGAQPASVAQIPAIEAAERTLHDARARHDSILQGPPPGAVETARHALTEAQVNVEEAERRLLAARAVPAPSTDDADSAVAASRARLAQAEARLRDLLGTSR